MAAVFHPPSWPFVRTAAAVDRAEGAARFSPSSEVPWRYAIGPLDGGSLGAAAVDGPRADRKDVPRFHNHHSSRKMGAVSYFRDNFVITASIRIGVTLALTVFVPSLSAQTPNAAEVISAFGSVQEQRQQQTWQPVVVNTWLPAGAGIRTGDRSRAALLLADETQIKINSNTELRLTGVRDSSTLFHRVSLAASHSQESVLSLSQGQFWLRARNKPANVKVNTPAVTAAIRGTEFDLRVGADGESVVTVLDGTVDFRNALGAVLVGAGERGLARVGQAPSKIVLLNPKDSVQWTLLYPASISPRDYPFHYASAAAARAVLNAGRLSGLAEAEALYDAGNLPAALKALSGLRTPEAAERRGWILLAQNRTADALAEFDAVLTASDQTRLGRSIAQYRLGRMEEAYRAADPLRSGRLLVHSAQLDLIAGDAARARSALETISSFDPAYAQAQALLSNVYLTQNRKADARAAAERAVAANPESPAAYLALSLVEQSAFNLPASIRAARKACALDPLFAQANLNYARLLFGSGETSKAERIIRQVIAAAPGEALAHSALGFILLARARNGQARTSFLEALRIDSTLGEPHLGLGILAMRGRHLEQAVEEFIEASTLEPSRSLYLTYMAKALYELRRFDQAFAALAAAEQLDPQDPTPHLYAGIFENDLIRPGAAVREFQEAIQRNDFRAVYRSRFLLDEDLATRNVDLAAAYERLGLTEWANLHAVRSEIADPANSAAHLFLADTFLNLPGRLAAGGGQLLLARLLMPANANSFNAFNSYTTLFDERRADWALSSEGGSFTTGDGTLNASGGTDRMAYGISWNYRRSDGFRPANDDQQDRTGASLFKLALTPHSDALFEYDHGNNNGGDHGGASALITNANDLYLRLADRSDREGAGYHVQIRPGSDVVAFFSHETETTISDNPRYDSVFGDFNQLIGYGHLTITGRNPSFDYQAAHLLKISHFSISYGADIFQGRQQSATNETLLFFSDPQHLIPYLSDTQTSEVRFRTAFWQASYAVTPAFAIIAGVNYDWANHDDIFLQHLHSTSRWNPSAGVMYSPTRSTTLRFAAMRGLQTHLQESVAPTDVAGFALSQNEAPLTASGGYSVGWDQEIGRSTFVRTTAFRRLESTPAGALCALVACRGQSDGGAVVLNRMLTDRWSFVSDFASTYATDPFSLRHEYDGTVGTYYVHPRGYSFSIREEYFRQRGLSRGVPGLTADVPVAPGAFLTDAAVSYQFPRKHGLLSLSVTNLTGRRYAFLADPLALDQRIPRRQVALSLLVNK